MLHAVAQTSREQHGSTHSWITLSYLMTENRRTCGARAERVGRKAAALCTGPPGPCIACSCIHKVWWQAGLWAEVCDQVVAWVCSIALSGLTRGVVTRFTTHAARQRADSQQRDAQEDIAERGPLRRVQSHRCL